MKLKQKDIKPTRERLLLQQGNLCAVCGLIINVTDAVLDHDHKTGLVRAVLHRNCNAFLGRIENNAPRHCITGLTDWLNGCALYLLTSDLIKTDMIHPTHRTQEEKKERNKIKAKESYQRRKALQIDKKSIK